MTDTTASSSAPEPQENNSLEQPREDFNQPRAEADAAWESVAFPGHVPLASISEPDRPEADTQALPNGAEAVLLTKSQGAAIASSPVPEPAPENLVQLIQDLNQCNDALLLRVTELEDDLERSQVALQAEVERHQVSGNPARLPVETPSGPVQQQIAQLLSELDIANDGLRRTTIHNETLQTELEASQQRVAQLERECTLLQQRFSEKNTALHQAEETCRDLKARLHRQQRYTLQFKAALEKCLNMSPGAGASKVSGMSQGQVLETASTAATAQPVAMPRSQQIQPWSASQASLTDNPSLTHLLRGLRGAGPATPAPVATQPTLFEAAGTGGFPEMPSNLAQPGPATTPELSPKTASETTSQMAPTPPAPAAADPAPAAVDPWMPVESAAAPPAPIFTEPSPWGEPVATAQPVQAPPASTPVPAVPSASSVPPAPIPSPIPTVPPTPAPAAAAAPAMPTYLTTNASTSPSPLVYPLRSQKKITSIAAVELPSFGRTVRRR